MEDLKYIKIEFRKGEPIHLSLKKWEEIIKSEQTLVPYKLDSESEWTGRTLNKADVTRSEYDPEYTKKENTRPYKLYRRISTDTIVQMFDGELPDNLEDYEEVTQ